MHKLDTPQAVPFTNECMPNGSWRMDNPNKVGCLVDLRSTVKIMDRPPLGIAQLATKLCWGWTGTVSKPAMNSRNETRDQQGLHSPTTPIFINRAHNILFYDVLSVGVLQFMNDINRSYLTWLYLVRGLNLLHINKHLTNKSKKFWIIYYRWIR